MHRIFYGAAIIAALATIAQAQSMGSMSTANELGSILASEEKCGLSYKPEAIEAYIAKKVKDDDMGFASTLSMMTQGNAVQIEEMSKSALVAHCSQVKRVAKSYGFTE